jgi:NitT/TauT family transport system ATP-binding protein
MRSQMPQQQPVSVSGLPAGDDATGGSYVKVSNVTKSFKSAGNVEKRVCEDICLEVPEGSFTSIVGPSGCGKSTVLNMCAGLLQPDTGTIVVNGTKIDGPLNGVGYVTQDANLLPWKTVEQNIELPLAIQKMPRRERAQEVKRWLDLVGLSGFARHYPAQLSGGMQKRVSIARSLIYAPRFVLMDEPFGPLVFVTHDLKEAIYLADEVVVMSGGPGTVRRVLPVPFERPRSIGSLVESSDFAEIYNDLCGLFSSELREPEAAA